MKRVKTIALLLAVGMLLSLAACGVPKTAPAETTAAPAPTETELLTAILEELRSQKAE